MSAGVPYGATDGLAFVATQILKDDNVAKAQRGHEELLDPSAEQTSVDQPVEHAWCCDAICTQPGAVPGS